MRNRNALCSGTRWSRRASVLFAGVGLLGSVSASAEEAAAPFGFTAQEGAAQRSLEGRFDSLLHPEDLRSWLERLSAEPNNVGAPHDKANAEFVRDLFRQWGWDAQIEVFEVLYPTLKEHALELVEPTRFVATLNEPPIAGDKSSERTDGLAPYNIYGADGDVTGELVYLNYGMDRDYKELARRGIDVKGRIVITRYGAGWRGLKPLLAQQHGAIGCIIYSDPRDDGYAKGDAYPKGGWRPGEGVQRGSVMDMTLYPGDPLTPGIGSTAKARRLPISEARTILKIPVLPISYADAQPLLAAIGGPVAPKKWLGALPITYHLGPGPAKVHLMIRSDWGQKPIYDVIARLRGAESPDVWVVRGNHRDGWVFGAWDPLSGHVAMLAEAQALGALYKGGWRPKRTLIYASWDAEEPGLIGSTEWAEEHAAELERKAVVYLNSDSNARGFLTPGGSHTLEHLVNDVAAGLSDPETGVSIQARLRAHMLVEGYEKDATDDKDVAEEKARNARIAARGGDLPIAALGSGSDYSAFLEHLGLASLNIEYHGEEDQLGVYHSKYDSFDHYVRFGDPSFAYGVVEAKTLGRLALRMADAELLPLQFSALAQTLADYIDQLRKLLDDKRSNASELERLLDQQAFELSADPARTVLPPQREAAVPSIDFSPLERVVARLKQSAQAYDESYARHLAQGQKLSAPQRQELNALLQGMERKLTDPHGLPGRGWFRHFVYAPGRLTGYAPKTVPAVREAIDASRWDEAREYVVLTAAVLAGFCDQLDQATALLRQST